MKMLTSVILASLLVFLSAGCATTPSEPITPMEWVNEPLFERLKSEGGTQDTVALELKIAKAKCKIQALQVPNPGPSCNTVGASCEGLSGFNAGLCESGAMDRKRCDYSAQNAAVEAQEEIFEACMLIADWHLVPVQ